MTSNSKLFKVGTWSDYDIQSSVDETYNPRNPKGIKKKITASDIAVVDYLRDNEINVLKLQPAEEPSKIDLIDIKIFASGN